MAQVLDLSRGIYRRIYGGFIRDSRICSVSLEAEAWYWRLHAAADDFGNCDGGELCLSACAGRRRVQWKQVERWLAELQAVRLIVVYEVCGEPYLHIADFLSSQPCGRNGKRVRRFPACPHEIDDAKCEDGANRVNPDLSKGIKKPPDESCATHSHSHSQPPPTSSTDPPKPEAGGGGLEISKDPERSEIVFRLLRHSGVSEPKARQLSAKANLTAAHVQLAIDEVQARKPKVDSPGGLLVTILEDGQVDRPDIPPATVCRWINAGQVQSVCGHPAKSAKHNGMGLHLSTGQQTLLLPPQKLRPRDIVFA